ncbi:FecR family protein [Ohtaekwangia koreensis]|uniref:FecR family protein n=1 Tax=Ohtaekwangia koreensis TaxID=688867 RepID=A0A1T5M4W5_9BACT|nr:FecR family protein [Ohtaekwangia koreensis]SKC83272.1 FecR family protein [Ohtaekwangia koreensis]
MQDHDTNAIDIDALVRKYIQNTCTPEELEAFIQLCNNPFLEDRLKMAMEKVWNDTPNQAHLRAEHSQFIRTQIEASLYYKKSEWYQLHHYWKVAAAVALLLISSFLAYQYQDSLRELVDPVKMVTVHNPAGKRSKILLPDGTTVWLNAESTLTYPHWFKRARRAVELSGEAFFEVKRKEDQPFNIQAGTIETTVLGTSFNIRSYQNEKFVITVATGKVKVEDAEKHGLLLLANQQTSYRSASGFSKIETINAGEALAWTKGTLLFNNKTFKEVATMLERWYNVKIILANDKLNNCVLMGEHTNQSLNSVLYTLQFILDIRYTYKDGVVNIKGEGCAAVNP